MWLTILSDQLPIVALVGSYPANQLIGRAPLRLRAPGLASQSAFFAGSCPPATLCGLSRHFWRVSPTPGQVMHVLRTRPPLEGWPKPPPASDLHVLRTPPAFVLSQDQTRHPDVSSPVGRMSAHAARQAGYTDSSLRLKVLLRGQYALAASGLAASPTLAPASARFRAAPLAYAASASHSSVVKVLLLRRASHLGGAPRLRPVRAEPHERTTAFPGRQEEFCAAHP